jgi:hypothetical protein
MTIKRTQLDQLKAVPEPLENKQRTARKPERETYAVYRLPDEDDDANTEREFLLTLPADQDVERRIKRDYGAGSYRVERRRGGRFVSVTEMHFDEPPRHEANATESAVPEDLEFRIAQAVDDVLEARRAERARAKALRPNPTAPQTTTAQATEQAPDPVGDALRLLREFKQLERETSPPAPTKSEPSISDDDRALMLILKDSGMRERITASLFSAVSSNDGAPPPWYAHVYKEFSQRPAFAERLLDRVFPKKEKASADNADDETEAAESDGDKCFNYLMEKCAANEFVTLDDEPLRAFALSSPDDYKQFIESIKLANADQIIAYLSDQYDIARVVLRVPHARAWMENFKRVIASD